MNKKYRVIEIENIPNAITPAPTGAMVGEGFDDIDKAKKACDIESMYGHQKVVLDYGKPRKGDKRIGEDDWVYFKRGRVVYFENNIGG